MIIIVKFYDQSGRNLKGFLVAQTTLKRHEKKSKNKDQPTNNHKK